MMQFHFKIHCGAFNTLVVALSSLVTSADSDIWRPRDFFFIGQVSDVHFDLRDSRDAPLRSTR